jgi:hypothetical protein
MLGLAKVAAVVGALLAPPVAYLAYSSGDNGNHYGQIKNGNNGNDRNTGTIEMSMALQVLWLVPGVLVFLLRVA